MLHDVCAKGFASGVAAFPELRADILTWCFQGGEDRESSQVMARVQPRTQEMKSTRPRHVQFLGVVSMTEATALAV